MKLRNKKTGEIGELQITEKHCAVAVGNGTASCGIEIYSSLAKLNEEWEDVPEEPKGINEIDVVLDAISEYCNEHSYYSGDLKKIKILNTVEEKLKAWKRLKDKGFRFLGCGFKVNDKRIIIKAYCPKGFTNDLDLLFGGEE